MTDDVGLDELVTFFRIQSAGDILGHAIEYVLPEGGRFGGGGDGVQIDDAEVALVVLQHGRPVTDGTEIITQCQLTGRLGAGEDDLPLFLIGDSHKVVRN